MEILISFVCKDFSYLNFIQTIDKKNEIVYNLKSLFKDNTGNRGEKQMKKSLKISIILFLLTKLLDRKLL